MENRNQIIRVEIEKMMLAEDRARGRGLSEDIIAKIHNRNISRIRFYEARNGQPFTPEHIGEQTYHQINKLKEYPDSSVEHLAEKSSALNQSNI